MKSRGRGALVGGQALVEFALTVPFLLLLILTVFDFGRAIWYYTSLAEASREGVRYAIVHGHTSSSPVGPGSPSYTAPNTDTVVTAIVRKYAFGMGPGDVAVLSTWPDGDNFGGHHVNVQTSFTYVPLTGMILGGRSIALSSSAAGLVVY